MRDLAQLLRELEDLALVGGRRHHELEREVAAARQRGWQQREHRDAGQRVNLALHFRQDLGDACACARSHGFTIKPLKPVLGCVT